MEHFIRLENLLKIEKKTTENSLKLKLKNRENWQKFEKRLEEEEKKVHLELLLCKLINLLNIYKADKFATEFKISLKIV